MRLSSLHIKHFRGLKDVSLEGLGSLNILVGDNNAGKTSILEAGYLFFNPLDFRMLYRIATQRDSMQPMPRVSRSERLHRLKWIFPHFKDGAELFESHIEILGQGDVPLRAYYAHLAEIIGIPPKDQRASLTRRPYPGQLPLLNQTEGDEYELEDIEGEEVGLHIRLGCDYQMEYGELREIEDTFWDVNDVFKYQRPNRHRLPINSTYVEPHGHRINGVYKRLYSDIYKMNAHHELIDLLKMYDKHITELVILEDDISSSLHVRHEIVGIAPVSIFGDGLRRVLYIAMHLISAKDGVCFLDEIDNAIHISVLCQTAEWILRIAKQLNVQLFVTTHNLEALDAFVSTSATDEVVAYNINDCGRSCRRYDRDLLRTIRYDRGLDIR